MVAARQTSASENHPPDFLNEYQGDQVIIYGAVFLTLQTLFLTLRFVSRWIGNIAWGWDDTFILAAAVACTGLIATCICNVVYAGGGYHLPRVARDKPEQLVLAMKYPLIISPTYYTASALPKLGVLALYLRTFASIRKSWPRRICQTTFVIVLLNWIVNVIVTLLMCIPIEYVWNKQLEGGGTCIDQYIWRPLSSLANIITDIIMLALPIPSILKMQTTKRVKIGVGTTFVVGNIGLVTSIIRFVGFFTWDFAVDPTWTMVPLMTVTMAEPELYLLAACLLSFKPLLRWLWHRSPWATQSGGSGRPHTARTGHASLIVQTLNLKASNSDQFIELRGDDTLMDIEQATFSHIRA